MRRFVHAWSRCIPNSGRILCAAGFMVTCALSTAAQLPVPIDTRVPPPPPPAEAPSPAPPVPSAPGIVPPETVTIPAGTRIAVVLDTPVSTRISKPGQPVRFKTSEALPVADRLFLLPDTVISGKVVRVNRPGAFGKAGYLRIRVDRLELKNGTTSPLEARLDSMDLDGRGRISADSNRRSALADLLLWTAQGTLVGAQVKGGKGAAVGAGAGATIALIMMTSRRGRDVYVEPGTPFLVILEQPVTLPGAALVASQQGSTSGRAGIADSNRSGPAAADSPPDPDRPKLKHRPKPRR